MRRNGPVIEKMIDIHPGDIVSFNAGGSHQVGIVLRREIRTVEPVNNLGVESRSPLARDCVQVMWSTGEDAGPRPEPFDRWSQQPGPIMWYPVMTRSRFAIFRVMSRMENLSQHG